MLRFGLKLWSFNDDYFSDACRFFDEGIYDYIELYIVPDSYERYCSLWRNLRIPYVIHAPHYENGMNPAILECEKNNMKLAAEAIEFANVLSSDTIIFHPGINGNIEVTASFFHKLNDKRIVVENKPYYSLVEGMICNGVTPEEIGAIVEKAGVGFCLDIGHAICAANAYRKDSIEYLKEFFSLKPRLFHLSDGDFNSEYDSHLHFGEGNYPLQALLNLIPSYGSITIESKKTYPNSLDDFKKDINYIRAFSIQA
jgi:sugar phosphate isomerase/epimerase